VWFSQRGGRHEVEFVLIDQEAEAAAAAQDYEECIDEYEHQLSSYEHQLLYLSPPEARPVERPASSQADPAGAFPVSRDGNATPHEPDVDSYSTRVCHGVVGQERLRLTKVANRDTN
jgi:hypothetical protein